MKDSFIFYRCFYESVKRIRNKKVRCEIYEAIFEFALNNNEIELTNKKSSMMMEIIKPLLIFYLKQQKNSKKN